MRAHVTRTLATYAGWFEGCDVVPADHPADEPFLGPEQVLKLCHGDIWDRHVDADVTREEAEFLRQEVDGLFEKAKRRQQQPVGLQLPFVDDTDTAAVRPHRGRLAIYHFQVFDPRTSRMIAIGTCWDIQAGGERLSFWIGEGRDRHAALLPGQPAIDTLRYPIRSVTLELENGCRLSFLRQRFEGEVHPTRA
jgi:hypothetical protein